MVHVIPATWRVVDGISVHDDESNDFDSQHLLSAVLCLYTGHCYVPVSELVTVLYFLFLLSTPSTTFWLDRMTDCQVLCSEPRPNRASDHSSNDMSNHGRRNWYLEVLTSTYKCICFFFGTIPCADSK